MYRIASYFIIAFNALLILLIIGQDKISPVLWMEATGRFHPLLLHLPIGFIVLTALLVLFRKKFDEQPLTQILNLIIILSAFSAVISAILGVFIATEGDYSEVTLTRHRNLGLSLSLITALLTSFNTHTKQATIYFKSLNFLSIILVILTGHFGAGLTHGEDFLTEPFKKDNKKIIPADSLTVFDAAIQPILDKKCVTCHNPQKKKGKLILTSVQDLINGGAHGPIWIPGKPDSSLIVHRINLPVDHEDHMPPIGKPQLSAAEIKLLEQFIEKGAVLKQLLTSLDKNDSIHFWISSLSPEASVNQTQERNPDLEFMDQQVIKSLNNPARTVTQHAISSPEISVGFYMASGFNLKALEELEGIAANITSMNLTGMPVTKEVLIKINEFSNLRQLNLNKSTINDVLLMELAGSTSIEKLDLAGTDISYNTLARFCKATHIKEIYLWGTKISDADQKILIKDFPEVSLNFGVKPDASEILKLTPPILVNESRILSPGEKIVLKHNLPGAEIRYVINSETDLDSLNGLNYKQPLEITQFTTLQARTVKRGWITSESVKYQFFTSGIIPTNSILLSPPSKDYRAQGIKTLTDRKSGDQENFRDGQWLGFKDNGLQATFNFQQQTGINKIVISYLKNIGSYIMPPASVEVYGGNEDGQFKLIKKIKPVQPAGYESNRVEGLNIELNNPYREIKIIITPVEKLPPWHSGKGDKGWIMIDEIFFYPAPTI